MAVVIQRAAKTSKSTESQMGMSTLAREEGWEDATTVDSESMMIQKLWLPFSITPILLLESSPSQSELLSGLQELFLE